MSAKTVLRRFWKLLEQRQLDQAVDLLDPEGTFWSRPIGEVPMSAFIYIMRAVQGAAPMTFDVRTEMERDDRAVIEFQGHGKFAGSGELYENNYVFVADVRDGLIHHLREYNDSAYSNEVFDRNLPPAVQAEFSAMVDQAHADRGG